ncbi:replication initiation protein [Apilactobacillus sp. M161]|uniref:Replication initiation protein n=1 Tax=Apilactobacillus xinyiensis TaxID=2841032 RepID=A0ABT0I3D4_9LACO|nr:replication initiation protein [Apilactobacillus xinyiensis]MCK8625214.1 replication initiation protein [Apilactobacillus xinyiensis]
MAVNKNISVSLKKLLGRQDYLVVQANDLSKAFGNLTSFEHKVLDYCFSFVNLQSKPNDEYKTSSLDLIRHLGLNESGNNYIRILKAFKKLNENTALYFKILEDGQDAILMAQLFKSIKFLDNGLVKFKFSDEAAPYIFELRKNYYSFKLSQLSKIKSKYSLIMLKLIEANRFGDSGSSIIKGSLEDFENWFIGLDKKWTPNRFKNKVLKVAINELECRNAFCFEVKTLKYGRKVIGYEIIVSNIKSI